SICSLVSCAATEQENRWRLSARRRIAERRPSRSEKEKRQGNKKKVNEEGEERQATD
ncbi:hypothetical protein ABG768_007252, partial [Culter alburnus]